MMREYTVFNVAQCEGLPDHVLTLGEVRVRNPDERDPNIDGFLACSGAKIKEGLRAYQAPTFVLNTRIRRWTETATR